MQLTYSMCKGGQNTEPGVRPPAPKGSTKLTGVAIVAGTSYPVVGGHEYSASELTKDLLSAIGKQGNPPIIQLPLTLRDKVSLSVREWIDLWYAGWRVIGFIDGDQVDVQFAGQVPAS